MDLVTWVVGLGAWVWTLLVVAAVGAGLYFWLFEEPVRWLVRRVRVSLFRDRAEP